MPAYIVFTPWAFSRMSLLYVTLQNISPATVIIVAVCIYGIMACSAGVTSKHDWIFEIHVLTHRGVVLEMVLITVVLVQPSVRCWIAQDIWWYVSSMQEIDP